ncbi:MAG: 6-phosphogluconolactonase [Acidobacteriota bacterium]|nr:6-phosphogluconolactonase [Acidobacteriota bacterium]
MRIVALADADAVARAAADRVVSAAAGAVRERGRFVIVLSGGSTPRRLYALLASAELRDAVPWPATTVLFGDERCVGPTDPESNYRMARETLLDRVPVPDEQVHRMIGEIDPARSADAYEAVLRGLYPDAAAPPFDLVLLGVGADGHTASLFPGTAALDDSTRWVAANHVPALETWRITLTYPALNAARHVVFMVTGQDKAGVFDGVFGRREPRFPAARIDPAGVGEVLADRAATGGTG